MATSSYEARINLALGALQKDPKLSIRATAKIHDVNKTTLQIQRNNISAQCDILANSRKLTDLEEKTIIQYIIELCAHAFHPRLSYVEDMANRLLCKRDASPISIRWAHNFVKRQPELQTRFTRKYDY